jgi:hypothetical protein
MTRVQFPAGQYFSFCHSVQTVFGAHLAAYPMGIGVVSSGVKQPGHEDNRLPPFSTKIKNVWAIHLLPHTSAWRGA